MIFIYLASLFYQNQCYIREVEEDYVHMSVDIYNEKLEPYDDGKRHKFSGTFDRLNDRLAIFKDLRIAGAGGNPIVKQLALHYLKTFKDLDLKRGDVVEFEGMVEKDSNNGFTIERPTQAEKIRSAAADDAKVDVVGDDWNWFEN